jgi:simple sugar transport system ATP-binding protein
MQSNELLVMQGISKTFPGVQALANVDFTLRAGEIHALMGENGAGKSTLIKVLTGVEHHDAGRILLNGAEIHAKSPHHAQSLGISTVYQEVNLCTNLSVAENILLGREPRRAGSINWGAMNARARELLTWLDVDVDVRQSVGEYPVAVQQMVAISRALEIDAKVLILDEPTSSLTTLETEKLFNVLRRLKAQGIGIIFITHFLNQVYAVADRITVLRNGKLVGTYDMEALPRYQLVELMIGRELEELEDLGELKQPFAPAPGQEPVLEATNFGQIGTLAPLNIKLYAGEVLGMAGLLGSGRTETANLIFGVDDADSGALKVDGKIENNPSPRSSIQNGLGYCPEDRKADGVVGSLTVRENIVLALQASRGWFSYLDTRKQTAIAEKMIDLLQISTPSPEQLMKNLSGGNQQKVILARWLATEPDVLILDEPTRGIDVGTKAEIQKLVLSLANEGKGCIFISSELDEVLRTSHRVMVMRDRSMVAELTGEEMNEQRIMETIAGTGTLAQPAAVVPQAVEMESAR